MAEPPFAMQQQPDLIGNFARHKVAANLLMILMIIGGISAFDQLNVQFFPNFELDLIRVRVAWSGASAEDVESGITIPLEQALKTVDNLHQITSTSTDGVSAISLELNEGSDTLVALDQVKQKVDEFRNLPVDAEKPQVASVVRYERVARVLISGTADMAELRHLAHTFEQQLLDRGVDKVEINGLPAEEISIQIPSRALENLKLSLDDIGEKISELSRDVPAGTFGERDNAREIRTLDQRRNEQGFTELPIVSTQNTRIDLGSIAEIRRQPEKNGVTLGRNGKSVVELVIRRAETGDSFESAAILNGWLEETRRSLPPGIEIHVFDKNWELIQDRINLLVKNGTGGLILVVIILFLFLSTPVAFWVAVGIPVSFAATLLILYLAGGNINMLSLFGLIMALGIIVDDAIVVGEDALTHYQSGEDALPAAEGGARRMLAPVAASSLTTVAAFLPLMMIGGPTGKILIAIPLVIIAAILASLVESFLILPGHLRATFARMRHARPPRYRLRLDHAFQQFRDTKFRPLVISALENRGLVLSIVTALLIVTVGMLAGGRIKFNFFPSPESTMIYVNAQFVPGTPRTDVRRFMDHLEQTLRETEIELSTKPLVMTALTHYGRGLSNQGWASFSGDNTGSMSIELVEPDQRDVRNNEFIESWRGRIRYPAGIDIFTIAERVVGPPGRDLAVRFTGQKPEQLKAAAMALADALKTIPGVSDIEDDMPFGKEQLIYSLTPAGESLGLTAAGLGRQMRAAIEGRRVQLFQDGRDEVEVKVQLPSGERERLAMPNHLYIRLETGESVPLATVAEGEARRGFEILRHAETQLAVEVSAEVNDEVNNTGLIIESLSKNLLPDLADQYGVSYSFEGRSAEQRDTLTDMKRGLIIGLLLIYLILAWVFASYGWPLVVMSAIPFGLIGALTGHLILDIDLTILSLFGFFGLSGIVINDSIILVSFYKHLRDLGKDRKEALIESSCLRLRAVLLTSLTTIGGLAPLLFETSLQAQFLIPMATAIAFGLAFSTILVLIVIPVLLSLHEDLRVILRARFTAAETPIGDNR
jgi:multidrug efflux pump subunit AcrB